MIVNAPGQIAEDIYMLGPVGVPVFLIDGESPVIFDAGFSFLGDAYARAIRKILNGKTPTRLFVTHSHYDHCGAVSVLKSHFTDLIVCASKLTEDILKRPNALKLIERLSKEAEIFAAKYSKKEHPQAQPFKPFGVDQILSDGDNVELGKNLSVHVLETPGHTRDHLSYYISEKKILIAGEAVGIPDATGYIVTDCLVDYEMYLTSVEKLAQLDIEILCLGHEYVYTGKDAKNYMKQAVDSCSKFLHLAKTCLEEEQGHMENVMKRIRQIEYDNKEGLKQTESAYMINLEARLNAVKNHLNK